MTYFITETQRKNKKSTRYFEFQKGAFHNRCWKETSLCLHVNTFDDLQLYDTFAQALPHFDYFGVTEVTPAQYETLKSMALSRGGEIAAVIEELDPWVRTCFQTEKVFTILGI